MNNNKSKQPRKRELPTKFEFGVDTIGMWFSAIVLFAVLATGIIIYRDVDIRIASSDTISRPTSSLR
ncbi:MAG: hypothetical protein WBF03_08635 [Xanthobacteraceae bacterium]